MVKILHVTPSYKPAYIYGGPIYSVASLCNSLAGKSVEGMEVSVITTLANGKEELPYTPGHTRIIDNVPVTYFKRITKDHSHFSPSLLRWLWLNAGKYEIVHIHAWWNMVSVLSTLICLIKGVKPIVSPRGMLSEYTFTKYKKIFHRAIGKHLLKRCFLHATTAMEANDILNSIAVHSGIVYDLMSEASLSDIRKTKYSSAISVIHNIVQIPEHLPARTRKFDGSLSMVFLSRIHPKKGLELLFEALHDCTFKYKLTVVGDGDPDYVTQLKKKAKQLNIDSHIAWIGPCHGDEKFKILASHDLLVLTSFNENFANVVIESIATGTPVLVSDMVGLSDWILQTKSGIVCKLNKDSILGALNSYYLDLANCKCLQPNTRPKVFTPELYLNFYNQILRN